MPYVIGTAGHIDHGKTSLVKALTGIDTDRLKEEKERGITIELGFAHLRLPRHGEVGLVDVPGHERFVRAMVAGAVGIDLVVLVVAADEGVMPQTREHLDICGLLGVRRGLVALTKCDLVEDELRELAVLDVREALRGSFLEEAPVLPCSAHTGQGLPELIAEIDRLLDEVPGRDPGGLVRLPVDRVFSMKGFGTVATGTLWAGRLRPGDELVALPPLRGQAAAPAKVRGVQVHGQPVEEAVAGQRTAVNLALPRESLLRGETLVRPGTLEASQILDVRLHHLAVARAPLRRRAKVLLHAGTAQRMAQVVLLDRGELAPGESGLAQVHLGEGLVVQPGDRFILRGFAPQKHYGTTLGGGEVLRVLSARHRRGTPVVVQALQATEAALAKGDDMVLVGLEVARSGVAGRSPRELHARLPIAERRIEAALQRLRTAQAIVSIGGSEGVVVGQEALRLVQERVLQEVADFHAAQPLSPGLGREELMQRLPPLGGDRDGVGEGRPLSCPPRLFFRALEGLVQAGKLVAGKEAYHLPGHDPEAARAAAGLGSLAERVTGLYQQAGLAPPRPEEAALALSAPLPQIKTTLELLLRQGVLVRARDLLFSRPAIDGLRERLVAFLRERGQITAQEFKDLCGQTRKFAIPLAEHFDAERVTLRVGDIRKLRVVGAGAKSP